MRHKFSRLLTEDYKLSSGPPHVVHPAEVHAAVLYLHLADVENGVVGLIPLINSNPLSLYLDSVFRILIVHMGLEPTHGA